MLTVVKVQWLKPLFSSVCRSLRFLLFLYYYLYSSFLSSTLVLIRVYCCSLLTTCTVLLSLSSIILFLSAFPEVPKIINRLYYVLYYYLYVLNENFMHRIIPLEVSPKPLEVNPQGLISSVRYLELSLKTYNRPFLSSKTVQSPVF